MADAVEELEAATAKADTVGGWKASARHGQGPAGGAD